MLILSVLARLGTDSSLSQKLQGFRFVINPTHNKQMLVPALWVRPSTEPEQVNMEWSSIRVSCMGVAEPPHQSRN